MDFSDALSPTPLLVTFKNRKKNLFLIYGCSNKVLLMFIT